MANPRRKHSKARSRTRRAQYKVKDMPQVSTCSNCGEPKEYHKACSSCGYYRGREVVETQAA
jgi:large subunit ribosomal protein L32